MCKIDQINQIKLMIIIRQMVIKLYWEREVEKVEVVAKNHPKKNVIIAIREISNYEL